MTLDIPDGCDITITHKASIVPVPGMIFGDGTFARDSAKVVPVMVIEIRYPVPAIQDGYPTPGRTVLDRNSDAKSDKNPESRPRVADTGIAPNH